MTNVRKFQLLVGLSFISYLIYYFLPFFYNYSEGIEGFLLSYHGYKSFFPNTYFAYYLTWLGLWILSTIGIFLFQNWGRNLYLILTVICVLIAPFSGFVIQSPIDAFFSNVTLLLDGAILTLAYKTPLADYFNKSPVLDNK